MEGRHCFGHLTIEENLLTGAFTRRDGRTAIARDLERIYQYFPKLKPRRAALAGYVSGGEQQMCALGRAMMAKPEMILLDEPAAGLNSGEKRTLHDLLDRIAAQGLTILIIDHDMTLIAGVAEHLTVLNFGRRIADGETAEVLRQPDVVAAYLGAS